MKKPSILVLCLSVLIGASFFASTALADNPTDQDLFNQGADAIGLRRATDADAAQSGGNLARVTAHRDQGTPKTDAEFRLNNETGTTTHTQGNACVQPEGNPAQPNYWLATGAAFGNPSAPLTEGGVPSPGETGAIGFQQAPVGQFNAGVWASDGDGAYADAQNYFWGGRAGSAGTDTFLDGSNCATGCAPSGINTIGEPLGGRGIGTNLHNQGTGLPEPSGFEIISDNLINLAAMGGDFSTAADLISQNFFPGQDVVHSPNEQPYN